LPERLQVEDIHVSPAHGVYQGAGKWSGFLLQLFGSWPMNVALTTNNIEKKSKLPRLAR
jgi:hypothetical protein